MFNYLFNASILKILKLIMIIYITWNNAITLSTIFIYVLILFLYELLYFLLFINLDKLHLFIFLFCKVDKHTINYFKLQYR